MFKETFFALLPLLLVGNFVCAQSADTEGTLLGTVVDPQGAGVATATLTIEKKGFIRTVSADQIGEFKIRLLPGKYRLTVNAVGFHKQRRKVVIAEGRNEPLRIKLDVIVQKFKCPPGHICL